MQIKVDLCNFEYTFNEQIKFDVYHNVKILDRADQSWFISHCNRPSTARIKVYVYHIVIDQEREDQR